MGRLRKFSIKVIASLMLISVIPITKPMSVIASDIFNNYNNITEVDLRKEANLQHKIQLDSLLAKIEEEKKEEYSGSWVGNIRVEEGRTQVRNSGFIRADNQPRNGTIFNTPGSSISWNGRGGNRVNVSFSFGWGPVSISLDSGRAGVVGFNATVPNHLIGSPVALYISHDVEGRELLVYERQNINSPWIHTRTNTSTAVIRQAADIRRVS